MYSTQDVDGRDKPGHDGKIAMREGKMRSIAIAALALLAARPALAQQGVSANEIVIGTAQDLSGPVVNFSKADVNGMRLRVHAINAVGAIHGRKLRLVVEDRGA